MTIFSNEPNSSFQSLSVYRETVTIKANEFPQPGYDWRMVHVQYGGTNLTLCLTRPLDIYNYTEQIPSDFPFCYPGTWTPREEHFYADLNSEVYDGPLVTADEWESTDDLKELGLIY